MARRPAPESAPDQGPDPLAPQPPLLPEGSALPQSATLEAFCLGQYGRKHQDQARAFARWAAKAGHKRHTVAEWRSLLTEFGQRPMGAPQ